MRNDGNLAYAIAMTPLVGSPLNDARPRPSGSRCAALRFGLDSAQNQIGSEISACLLTGRLSIS